MKSAEYRLVGGGLLLISYDEDAPCRVCGEPVGEASMGGTDVCPACDCGVCRYCGVRSALVREELDGGRSLRQWREHMAWHHKNHEERAHGL